MFKPNLSALLLIAAVNLCVIPSTHAALIQWPPADGGNDHWYEALVAPGGISWADANTTANAAGGYLATLTTTAENNFVFSLIDSPEYWVYSPAGAYLGPWIGGLKTNDGWQWVTNEPFTFTNWSPGAPNNAAPYEDRLMVLSYSPQPTALWNDYSDARAVQYGFPVGFVVEYNAAPVPIPGSIWLFSSSLVGLISLRGKGRRCGEERSLSIA